MFLDPCSSLGECGSGCAAIIADEKGRVVRVQVQPLDRAVWKYGIGGGGRAENKPLCPTQISPRQVGVGQVGGSR